MNPSAPNQFPADFPGASETDSWRWHIVAVDDPFLLAHILQKLAVPEIDLHAVQSETGGAGSEAQGVQVFIARRARA
jgi:hypothetical protein